MRFSLEEVVSFLVIYQAVVFVLFLIANKDAKPLFVRVLILLCSLLIVHFVYMIYEDRRTTNNLFLGPFFGFIYGPLYYVYTKSLIDKKIHLRTFLWHFLPSLFVLIGLFAFRPKINKHFEILGILVTIHFIIYLLLSLQRIFNYRRALKSLVSSFQHISLKWLEIIIYIQLFTIALMLVESYFQTFTTTQKIILLIYILALVIINCFYHLGLKQVRLYKGLSLETETAIVSEYSISEESLNTYSNSLSRYVLEEKPYLEYDISLDDLSKKISISKRNLSHVMNKKFKMNFYDFINHYRLIEAKEDLKHSSKTIKEIMYDSGFANKSSFNAIFKKQTGLTPTQFRQKHKS